MTFSVLKIRIKRYSFAKSAKNGSSFPVYGKDSSCVAILANDNLNLSACAFPKVWAVYRKTESAISMAWGVQLTCIVEIHKMFVCFFSRNGLPLLDLFHADFNLFL